MEDEEIVLLTRCANTFEAEMIRGLLEGADIESFATNQLTSDFMCHQMPILNNSVDIYVRRENADLAVELLNADIVKE